MKNNFEKDEDNMDGMSNQLPASYYNMKYLIFSEFAQMLGVQEPVSRKLVQSAFINYVINNNMVDLKTHHYLVYKNP